MVNPTPATPLPVELTAFTAEREGTGALLRWATASEKNSAYFAVESSSDGHTFSQLARVAGHGNSYQAQAYSWADAQVGRYAAATVYYQLRQADIDGTAVYSPIRTVVLPAATGPAPELLAYPNPAQGPCGLRLSEAQAGPATLRIVDAQGRQLAQCQVELAQGNNTLAVREVAGLRPGLYLVQVQQGAQQHSLQLVRE